MATDEEALRSADALLRHAAAADAARAGELVARLPPVRLLEVAVAQAELAVDDDRPRPAGIDVVAELERAAIEEMGLPQDLDLDLEDDDPLAAPLVTGWELVTVPATQLAEATLMLTVRPWHLLLVAFADRPPTGAATRPVRRFVAAAADGRVLAGRLRLGHRREDDHELLGASVSADADDLGEDAALARSLLAALRAAAHTAR